MPKCDKCDKSFKSSQKLAAHTRWEHHDGKKNEAKDANTSMDDIQTSSSVKEPDTEFYAGENKNLEVIGLEEPKSKCPECSARVRPGTNCKDCGEELNWAATA